MFFGIVYIRKVLQCNNETNRVVYNLCECISTGKPLSSGNIFMKVTLDNIGIMTILEVYYYDQGQGFKKFYSAYRVSFPYVIRLSEKKIFNAGRSLCVCKKKVQSQRD